MSARDNLLPRLIWNLGDGRKCNVMVQPWFEGAVESSRQTVSNRGMCVRDLVIEGTGTWNVELLIQLFRNQVCLQILTNIQLPRDGAGEDRLVFIDSST